MASAPLTEQADTDLVFPQLLTLAETAKILHCTPQALHNRILMGTAPKSAKFGGRRYFRASDVAAHINAAFADEPSE